MMTNPPNERRKLSWLDKFVRVSPLVSILCTIAFAIFLAFGFDFQSPSEKFLMLEIRMNRHDATDSLIQASLIKLNNKIDVSIRLQCQQASKRDLSLLGMECP